jgi:hypothetical protein
MTNEAFARVKIDALLAAQGWNAQAPNAVRYEVVLPDSTRADISAKPDRAGGTGRWLRPRNSGA